MEKNRLGMLCFIATEAIFFGMLLVAYLYFRFSSNGGPGPGPKNLDVATTAFFSLFLFSSSFTIWQAERALHRQNRNGVILWLVATVVLGVIFLSGQGLEWSKLIAEDITVSRNTFGSTFFTLTGFHGLHVLAGLIMISMLAGFAIAGWFKGPKSVALDVISLYWHFVDIVWVVLLTIIYLIPLVA